MEYQVLRKAVTAFLRDVQDQLGMEAYQEWAGPLGLPDNLIRLNKTHLATVEQLCNEMQVDLLGYLPSESKAVSKQLPSGRKADHFAIYEKHPRTGEVILITCDRTVDTVIKQIQQADPDIAAQIPWDDYGWTFLVSYTPQIQTIDVETVRNGKLVVTEREMRGQRTFPDYVENGKIETPGWRTAMPAELVLKQRIANWEVIPYDRKADIGLAHTSSYNQYHDVFVPTTAAEIREHGWRLTKISNKRDANGYFAEDETGRIRSANKPTSTSSEAYFGYKNMRQTVKTRHKSGGKSPNPQTLPGHLQLASRFYNLPRIDRNTPARKFYLYYEDGHIWRKDPNIPAERVAFIKWSDDREAHIPIPMFPLSQGNNRRIWDCVLSYLGLRGSKTARVADLEKVIRTPLVKYDHVSPTDINRSRVGGNRKSKRYAREKHRQQVRVKHRKAVKIC